MLSSHPPAQSHLLKASMYRPSLSHAEAAISVTTYSYVNGGFASSLPKANAEPTAGYPATVVSRGRPVIGGAGPRSRLTAAVSLAANPDLGSHGEGRVEAVHNRMTGLSRLLSTGGANPNRAPTSSVNAMHIGLSPLRQPALKANG